jgi:phosphatidylserine decarboxylase
VKDAIIVSLLSITPRKRGARTMGWIARTRASRMMVRWFVRAYGVDLSEAAGTLADYPTLEALFTRALRPGLRPIDADPEAVTSPVDGVAAFVGRTVDGRVEVAPGRFMQVAELLGERVSGERDAVVLYLSPKDYHRVHVPREGQVAEWRYVPGTLWPVFPAAVRRVKGLFERNERVCVRFATDRGPLDVVLVGAFGVGRISLAFCDLVTNAGGKAAVGRPDPKPVLGRGDLLGMFHLGSTVVLVSPPGRWRWTVAVGERVRLGEAIGRAPALLTALEPPTKGSGS